MKIKLLLLCLISSNFATSKSIKKSVLFIGNSYTYVNDLPKMISDAAMSVGDTLVYDNSTPGGWTFMQHSSDPTTNSKIAVGKWDYVVLQEQSQRPSFPITQVQAEVFPFAKRLDSLISVYNTCAETIFYVTWGRKNGDAGNCPTFPPVCTYIGMDSLLQLRYKMMADSNKAVLSPVAAVWRRLRTIAPTLDLYSSDESHPSVAGTYAAACCFYATIFRKDPSFITFNSSLSASNAASIRAAAKLIVFDSLKKWNIGIYDPKASFSSITASNTVTFTNTSQNATSYFWDFGDSKSATIANPTHTYASKGTFSVRLIVSKCGQSDTVFKTINIGTSSIQEGARLAEWTLFPNPTQSTLNIRLNIAQKVDFKIFNSIGQLVQEGCVNEQEKTINVSTLSKGIYSIHLFNKQQVFGQRKFIKE
jgi:hypothetical protein